MTIEQFYDLFYGTKQPPRPTKLLIFEVESDFDRYLATGGPELGEFRAKVYGIAADLAEAQIDTTPIEDEEDENAAEQVFDGGRSY